MTGERILLVDDEAEFVEALTLRLENRGLHVDSAKNGVEAIAMVREHGFTAIVLDLAMPGMDGIETLRALKDLNPKLQVILLTGHGNIQSGIQAMKAGAMDFLEKPVKLEVLLEKIGEASCKCDQLEQERLDEIVQEIMLTKAW